jgi:hypothetical protein
MTAWNFLSKISKHQEKKTSYGSVGVSEATSELAILELRSHGRAYTQAAAANLSAAGASAVGIRHASTGCELLALAVTNILSTGVVGSENGHDGDGD